MKVYLYIFVLLIVTVLLSLVDLPALLKKKDLKELFVVVGLFSIGFILNFLLIIGVKLPDLNQLIVSVLQVLWK